LEIDVQAPNVREKYFPLKSYSWQLFPHLSVFVAFASVSLHLPMEEASVVIFGCANKA